MTFEAADTMTCELIKIGMNEDMETAYLRMKDNRIRHLPVVDSNNKVIGILSDRDVFRAMKTEVRDWHSVQTEKGEFDPRETAKEYMSWPVRTVYDDTDVKLVIRRMMEEKISAFLVSDGTKVVGIVTTEDLMKLLYSLLGSQEVRVPEKEKSWIKNFMSYFENEAPALS